MITITDQFCGAGGSSAGARGVDGVEIKLALNHWRLAVETHNTNFPNTLHDCTDISAADPRRYPSTDILITSPECTNHSLAKGKKRKNQAQMHLWEQGKLDPAEERSRATMWDVPRFAEYHKYKAIIVENVVDARHWIMWDAWLHAMQSLGYDWEIVYHNSMFAWPTPQSRDRMYVVFWLKGNKRPNLRITPLAWCQQCGQDVDAVQVWKHPDKKWGRYGKNGQYIYACPKCAKPVEPYYYCAANAIDWSLPGERIGDRKKPLKARTMERIEYGLKKFAKPFVQRYDGTHQRGADEAFYTQTTRDANTVVMPFLVETAFAHAGERRSYGVDGAMPTQSTRQTMAFVIAPNDRTLRARDISDVLPTQLPNRPGAIVGVPPYVVEFWNTSNVRGIDKALSTVEAGANHHGIVVPPFMVPMATWSDAPIDLSDPMPTQTTRSQPGLVLPPFLINSAGDLVPRPISDALPTQVAANRSPYLVSYYGADDGAHAITDALGTQSTHDRHGLVQPGQLPDVSDCYFRMLAPREIGRAMAFPSDYVVLGNQREQVKQYGNAVTPPMMKILVSRLVETFQ